MTSNIHATDVLLWRRCWIGFLLCFLLLTSTLSCSWAQKSRSQSWPYDPDFRPITQTEVLRVIRNPKTTVDGHELVIARASSYGLLDVAVAEYVEQHHKRLDDALLQSAFGYAFFIADRMPSKGQSWQRTHTSHNYSWAVDALERGTKLAPDNAFCWRALGYAGVSKSSRFNEDVEGTSELPSLKRSLEYLDKAIKLAPNDARTYRVQAWAYQFRSKYYSPEKELAAAQKAVKLAPRSSKSLYRLALAYSDRKNYKTAYQWLQKSYALRPPKLRNAWFLNYYKQLAQRETAETSGR